VDIASKIMLVASILMMGYNISEFLCSYQTLSEKADDLKEIARENDAGEAAMRRSNLLLSLFLSSVYVVLIWFSGFAMWITVLVAIKLVWTLVVSDFALIQILRKGEFPRKTYLLSKVDAFLNALVGLSIALFLVL
jgi:hypothetical protein